MTSGASETIFKNFLSRSSRATGPKTRVPTGSFESLITTAAFSSKRMYVPSRRRASLRRRTITALTTLPFLTVPSGEDSLTAAVTTSPRPAFLPEAPPSGRITCSLRAPELSATASIVLICTAIACSPYPWTFESGPSDLKSSRPWPLYLGLRHRGRLFNLAQRRAPNNLFQRPALQLAQRAALANANHIADARRVLLVMGIELLGALDDALVLGVRLAHLDLDH